MTAPGIPLTVDDGDPATEANAAWLAEHLSTSISGYMARTGVTPFDWRGEPLSREEVGHFRRVAEEGLLVVTDNADLLIAGFHAPKRYRLFQSYDGGASRPQ